MVVSRLRQVRDDLPDRRVYSTMPDVLGVPNLIQSQIDSFDWLKTKGLGE